MYVCMYVCIFLELLIWAIWPVQAGHLPQECRCQLRVSGQLSRPSAGAMVVLLKEVDCYVWEVVLIGCVIWLAGCHGQC